MIPEYKYHWIIGGAIGVLLFILFFTILGGFNPGENYAGLIFALPISLILPLLGFVFTPLSFLHISPFLAVLIIYGTGYFLLGAFIGGLGDIKNLFSKDSWKIINIAWIVVCIILLTALCFYLFNKYYIYPKEKISEYKFEHPSSIEDCGPTSENDVNKYTCLEQLAAKEKNVAICDSIQGLGATGTVATFSKPVTLEDAATTYRYECIAGVAGILGTTTLCDKIPSVGYSQILAKCLSISCFNLEFSSKRVEADQCYYDVAIKTQDAEMCNNISRCDGFTPSGGCLRISGKLQQECLDTVK